MTESGSECNNTNETNQISRQLKYNQHFVVFVLPKSRPWILKHAGLQTVSEWQWISGAALLPLNSVPATPFLFQTCAIQPTNARITYMFCHTLLTANVFRSLLPSPSSEQLYNSKNSVTNCQITYVEPLKDTLNEEVKVKVTLVQALRLCTGRAAHRGSTSVALLSHDQRH
jgi:hypothetical protein